MSVTTVGPSQLTPGLSVLDPSAEQPGGYDITGMRYPVITKTLAPGEAIRGEPGSMLMMDNKVNMSTGFARSGIMGAASAFVGGDVLVNTYKNKGSEPQNVSLSGNMPFGVVMPVDLEKSGGKFNAKTGAYFAGDESVKISSKILRAQSCAACCCGGMPPVMQHLSGEGVAFVLGSGTVVTKNLADGEKIVVSTDALLGFSNSVKFDVKCTGSVQTWCFGGEGCFNTTLEGPGEVYLQSFSSEKLKRLVLVSSPQGGDGGAGGGGDGGGPSEEQTDEAEDQQPTLEAEEMER